MKTKMILKTGLAMALFVLATGTINAYNGTGRNRSTQITNEKSCVDQIQGLSNDQVTNITALEKTHEATMAELRTERRATADVKQKEEIRAKMINQRDEHRSEVNSLLTPEQQKVYAQLHESPNHKNQQSTNNRGNGNGNGKNAQASKRGNGNGNGNHSGNGCRR